MYNGIINVYKEKGFTSHDVVAKMRGICGQKKIGHTGTLDPEAEGVLPVCLGNATRLCDMLADHDKEYMAVLRLGVSTDTQDMTGQILTQKEVTVSEAEVYSTVERFRGEYLQIPPMYSALKVNGKKLYELARAGKEVERRARPVFIYEIEIIGMNLPILTMRVRCSKGTYIRTLCSDIGGKLGCGGAMQSLVRTCVGQFRISESLTLSRLQERRDNGTLGEVILPTDACFSDVPALHVKEEAKRFAENGNFLQAVQTAEQTQYEPGQKVRIYDTAGRFYGIYAYDAIEGRYIPVKMFL